MRHAVGPLDRIPAGEGRNVRAGQRTIAVFHTRTGEVFAIQPECPHRRGPLADGLLGGASLVCPLHDRAWDLRTGASLSGGDCPLATFPAQVIDGQVVLELPD